MDQPIQDRRTHPVLINKKNFSFINFCCDNRTQSERIRKVGQIVGSCKITEKVVEHENRQRYSWKLRPLKQFQRMWKEMGWLEIRWRITVTAEYRVKEDEKLDKLLNLVREQKKLWNLQLSRILIVVEALETVTKNLNANKKGFHIKVLDAAWVCKAQS